VGAAPRNIDRTLVIVSIVLAIALLSGLFVLGRRNAEEVASTASSSTTRPGGSSTTQRSPSTTEPFPVPIPSAPGSTTPRPPGSTRPRVDPAVIEAEVERIKPWLEENRGLRFRAPVNVSVLPPEEFDVLLVDLVEEERANIAKDEVMLKAFGFIPGDTDLVETQKKLLAAGVAGFYNDESKELVVEGVELNEAARETLMHELLHALQDQNLDLNRPELDERKDEVAFGLRAIAEGDAKRMEVFWETQLSDEQRAELRANEEEMAPDVSGIPPALLAMLGAPYELGRPLTEEIFERTGQAGLDEAFRTPPDTSEQVVRDTKFFGREPRIEVPPPPADGKQVDDGVFGELLTILLVSPIVGQSTGDKAAKGWGGDWGISWLGGEDGNTPCGRVDWKMDTTTDLDELETALTTWAARMPQATVERPQPDVVRATSCMPQSGGGGESRL